MSIPRPACRGRPGRGHGGRGRTPARRTTSAPCSAGAGRPGAGLQRGDGEFEAKLTAIRKDRARFAVGQRLRAPAPEPEIRLLVALLKRDPMDWLVEKATELGATRITPRPHPPHRRRPHQRRAAAGHRARRGGAVRAAVGAGGRGGAAAAPRARCLGRQPLVVAMERAVAAPFRDAVAGLAPPLALLVGPEGGFEGAELDDLRRRAFVVPSRARPPHPPGRDRRGVRPRRPAGDRRRLD
jgi:16S rRNA (uracil1498-N3)-methyltransferase